MSEPKDTCLQCGQSREEVKRNDTYCATVTGYEVVEGLDEWDRHHWRDWSDADLKRHGIHPSLWAEHRRTGIYDLEFPARESHCMANGHTYPRPWHPPMHRDLLDMYPADLCLVCYTTKAEETRND